MVFSGLHGFVLVFTTIEAILFVCVVGICCVARQSQGSKRLPQPKKTICQVLAYQGPP